MKKEKSDQNAVAELTREGLYKENKWLWEENARLKEKIKRLEFDVDAWHQLKLLLEGEIERLRGENEYLQNRVKGAENMIELLKEDKRSYEDKLTELMEFIEKNFGIE